MKNIADTLAQAARCHQAGDLSQAEFLYRQVLAAEATNLDAANSLGIVLAGQSRLEESVVCFRHAIQVQPANAGFHSNLGIVLSALDRHDQAAASHWESIRLNPQSAISFNNLGSAFQALGMLDEAGQCYREALRLAPDFADAHKNQAMLAEAWSNLGVSFYGQKRLDDAIHCFQEVVRQKPDHVGAINNLGIALKHRGRLEESLAQFHRALQLDPASAETFNNLGTALEAQGKLDEAIVAHDQAVRLQPGYVEAWYNLARAHQYQRNNDESIRCYQQALRLRPEFPDALNNLGLVFEGQDRFDEALASYREALRCRPNFPEALTNQCILWWKQRNFDQAIRCCEEAMRLDPNFADAHGNLGQIRLLLGDFERGLPESEWRLAKVDGPPNVANPSRWDGSDLAGRTILLQAEQGSGDTLQFIRYAPLVKDRGGKVIVQCQASLLRLLASMVGIDQLVAQGSPLPAFAVRASILSLPYLFRTALDTIPAAVPYLQVDANLVARWRDELNANSSFTRPGFRIGILWQGNPTYGRDRERSIPLAQFEPLASVAGVQLVSLQKGPGVEQLRALGGKFSVLDLEDKLGDDSESMSSLAAIMMNLDLVISCDTAIAHLAGALGVQVWVALPFLPDWRWMLEREDSPWYPTMRLFRQSERGRWADVFGRMVAHFKQIK